MNLEPNCRPTNALILAAANGNPRVNEVIVALPSGVVQIISATGPTFSCIKNQEYTPVWLPHPGRLQGEMMLL